MPNEMGHHIRKHLHNFARLSYVHSNPMVELQKLGFAPHEVIDCSLGTNPFGCSPFVVEALEQMDWTQIHRYPDPEYQDLTNSLISFWYPIIELNKDQILIGAGTSGLLEKTLKAMIEPGRTVLGYAPQFTEFATEVMAQGGHYVAVPLDKAEHHIFNLDRFLDAVSPDHALLYIDNPNNPTGQIIPLDMIRTIVSYARNLSLPVLVDEAYGDFSEKSNSSLCLVHEFENLITVRSFSKGSGLANFRVGYAVMQESLMVHLRKVDLPFPISSLAASAAALSLADEDFVIQCRKKIADEKRKLITGCPQFYIAETDDEIPILVLGVDNQNIHLGKLLFSLGILSESGSDFHNLGQNYVRLRIPPQTDELIRRLNTIELL